MYTSKVFQLIDTSLPVGGFVYSMGMEAAIKSKHLKNEEDVKRYLCTYVSQLFSFDFPFLDAAYESRFQTKKWSSITEAYTAMLMNPAVEKSSLVLGKNWMRLLSGLYPDTTITEIQHQFEILELPLHYTIVFGLCMNALQISLDQARMMYQFTALRDQVSALTRLGTVGPTGGQELLTYALAYSDSQLATYQKTPYQQAYKSAYLLEIIQLSHDAIYSKLFQN